MHQWTVDRINRLAEQSFWYRVGNAPQQRINTLTLSSWAVSGDDLLTVNYADPSNRFTMQLIYLLTGSDPGSGVSDISETIKIKNTSAGLLDFHLYEYADVDLLGLTRAVNSSLQLTGMPVNTATQTNGVVNFSETVVTPAPSLFEAGYAAPLLSELSGGSVYKLNDSSRAVNGDLAWAFQWDATIGSDKTLLVSKDLGLTVVPEPSAIVLFGVGAIGLFGWGWQRRKRPTISLSLAMELATSGDEESVWEDDGPVILKFSPQPSRQTRLTRRGAA